MDGALAQAVNGFLYNRAEQSRTGTMRDGYRDSLKSWLMKNGREDENGHRWLDFDDPLTIEGMTFRAIQAQRKISSSIDLDKTEALAKRYGVYDEVFPVIEVREFNEDALYALNQRGTIPDDALDSLITETETFAIVPVKQ